MRASTWLILAAWAASTGWLLLEKVIPPLVGGESPEYASAPSKPEPAVWRILWNGRQIGLSASNADRDANGKSEIRSVVAFDHLPFGEMAAKLFGPFGAAIGALAPQKSFEAEVTVATSISLAAEKRLERLHTAVSLGDGPPLFHIRGKPHNGGKLLMTFGSSDSSELHRQEISIPSDALVNDAFSPHPEMVGLRVGQKWTVPVYRPFPPGAPMRILAAQAERHEFVPYGRDSVETIVVVYRDEAGSGIRAARDPVGRTWVRGDGVVLRQELNLSGLKILLERVAEPALSPAAKLLEDAPFAALQGAPKE